jgi:hypothetical protein
VPVQSPLFVAEEVGPPLDVDGSRLDILEFKLLVLIFIAVFLLLLDLGL